MGWLSGLLPRRSNDAGSGRTPGVRQVAADLDTLVRYARRPDGDAEPEGDAERDVVIAQLQNDLARLCREPSPLMQRVHLFLSVVEAECQIRIHRGTLPLTNEEFENLVQAIRAIDGPEDAETALQQRKSLAEAGYIQIPPRARRSRRRA